MRSILYAQYFISTHTRQTFNDITQQQASTVESYTTSMPSGAGGRLKRSVDTESDAVESLSTLSDAGGKPAKPAAHLFKKPKNMTQSQLMTTNSGQEGVATMDVRISDFILSNGLPPSLSECPKLKLVLEGAKHIPNSYKPPGRQIVAGPLLDAIFSTIREEIKRQVLKESTVFGIAIFGDGATHLRIPYINILAAGVHNDAGLLDIADCSGHVAKGYKKDAEYIANLFIPHMERLDPDKTRYVIHFPELFPCVILTPYDHVISHPQIIGLICVLLMERLMSRRPGPSSLFTFLE